MLIFADVFLFKIFLCATLCLMKIKFIAHALHNMSRRFLRYSDECPDWKPAFTLTHKIKRCTVFIENMFYCTILLIYCIWA